jgi:hypothetical protein
VETTFKAAGSRWRPSEAKEDVAASRQQDTCPIANNRFLESNAGALLGVGAKAAGALVTERLC